MTPSSSAAATTASSAPPTWARPACARWSSSVAIASAAPSTPASWRPGARVPTLAHTVGRLRPSVVRDLDLKAHGLSFLSPIVRVFAPSPDGSAVTLFGDVAATVEGLQGRSAKDAQAYPGFERQVRALGRFLAELGEETPPDITSPGFGDALAGLKLGRTYRGLGKLDARTLLRVLPMAVADFVAEAFETDALQAAIAWRGVRYAHLGPWSGGSTAVLLTDGAGNEGGAAGETLYARGGPGAVADALAAAGTSVRRRDPNGGRGRLHQHRRRSRDGRRADLRRGHRGAGRGLWHRRQTHPGRARRSGHGRTVDALASRQHPPAGRRGEGQPGARRDADLPGRRGDPRRLRGRIVVAPGIDAIERAFDAAKYGRPSETPIIEATIPSLVDPSLVDGAPDGTQVMSVIAQYAPYQLRDGGWDEAREALGDRSCGSWSPWRRASAGWSPRARS